MDYTFFLRTPDGFGVILATREYSRSKSLTLSEDKVGEAYFKLTDGKLTAADESLVALFGPIPRVYPPLLAPVIFVENGYSSAEFKAVAETDPS